VELLVVVEVSGALHTVVRYLYKTIWLPDISVVRLDRAPNKPYRPHRRSF
jgi:hypothetical protein